MSSVYDGSVYPIYNSKEKYDNYLELLYIEEYEKKHYVLITDFDRLMCNYNKYRVKKIFASVVYIVLVVKNY